jgi:hypothetical protein
MLPSPCSTGQPHDDDDPAGVVEGMLDRMFEIPFLPREGAGELVHRVFQLTSGFSGRL